MKREKLVLHNTKEWRRLAYPMGHSRGTRFYSRKGTFAFKIMPSGVLSKLSGVVII